MASTRRISIAVAAAFLAMAVVVPAALAKEPAAVASSSGPMDVIAALEKDGHYTIFIGLLKSTHLDMQLNRLLNDCYNGRGNGRGYTVLVPTDDAFKKLKPGTLESLTPEQMVSFVLRHILPQFCGDDDSLLSALEALNVGASKTNQPHYISRPMLYLRLNVVVLVKVNLKIAIYGVDKVLVPLPVF
ncbi:hypothetical protein ACP70R_041240 [Stipagrostis hirtigluma subsp. patula]